MEMTVPCLDVWVFHRSNNELYVVCTLKAKHGKAIRHGSPVGEENYTAFSFLCESMLARGNLQSE